MTRLPTIKPRFASFKLLLITFLTGDALSETCEHSRSFACQAVPLHPIGGSNTAASQFKRAVHFGRKTLGRGIRREYRCDNIVGVSKLSHAGSNCNDSVHYQMETANQHRFNVLESWKLRISDGENYRNIKTESHRNLFSINHRFGAKTHKTDGTIRQTILEPVDERAQDEEVSSLPPPLLECAYESSQLPLTTRDYSGWENVRRAFQNAIRDCCVSECSTNYFASRSLNRIQCNGIHDRDTRWQTRRRRQQQRHHERYESASSISLMASKLIKKSNDVQSPPLSPQQDYELQPRTKTTPTPTETIEEPSPAVLSGITQPLISESTWSSLTGREFHFPSVLRNLVQMGIRIAAHQSNEFIEWTPANKMTKQLTEEGMSEKELRRTVGEDMDVLVWKGQFKDNKKGYGSDIPVVKTVSVVPMSPKQLAELLMDSTRVKEYNQMSLGRKDEVIIHQGMDTSDGEAKIVRNLAKPPLDKKIMEFVTVMCARRLTPDDNMGVGIMGGGGGSKEDIDVDAENFNGGYIVMSRAVGGNNWQYENEPTSNTIQEQDEPKKIRCEILLGINLLRSIPGQPEKTELTAVTHVKTIVPAMLAGKVGAKGAIDFVRDIRNLCK